MLQKFEHKIYSQTGADGIISFLLDCVGRGGRYFVEFGVENGIECNTRYLREYAGFNGLMMDNCNEHRLIGLYRETVTAENINFLFEKYGVPFDFEILSIDIDSNDLWIWKAIDERYAPKIVIIEYNGVLPPPISATIPYSKDFQWDYSSFSGASLTALNQLAQAKGYSLVYCDQAGVNAYFIRNDLRKYFLKHFPLPTVEEAFVPIHIINGLKGTTIYKIGQYTIYGHGKFDQSEKQFIDFSSGKPIYIEELDSCETIPLEEVQQYWSTHSEKYFEIAKRYGNA